MGCILNFKKTEVFVEGVKKRKETPDIEFEVWTLEKNKFKQLFNDGA